MRSPEADEKGGRKPFSNMARKIRHQGHGDRHHQLPSGEVSTWH
jgi:hypothetical protein